MSIAKPPSPTQARNPRSPEAFIRGANMNGHPGKEIALTVRVRPEVLEQIDQRVAARRVKTARHTWLLEAILDKLDSEKC